MNIEDFEELQDKLSEQMEEVNQRQEFFLNAAGQEENDELMDELNELEAEMAEDELNVEIGSGAVKNEFKVSQPIAQGKVSQKQEQNEEDLLAQMMA